MLKRIIFANIFLCSIINIMLAEASREAPTLPDVIPRDNRNVPFTVPVSPDINGNWQIQKAEFLGSYTVQASVVQTMITELGTGSVILPDTKGTVTLVADLDVVGYKEIIFVFDVGTTGSYLNRYFNLIPYIDTSLFTLKTADITLNGSPGGIYSFNTQAKNYTIKARSYYYGEVKLKYVIFGKK